MAWGRMPRLYFHREIVTAFETIKSNVHLGNGVSAADNFQSRILFAENRFRPFHVFHDWYAKGTSCPAWAAPDTFSPIMSQQFIMFPNSLRHLSPRGGQGGKHNKSCCLSAYLPAHTVKTAKGFRAGTGQKIICARQLQHKIDRWRDTAQKTGRRYSGNGP